ncbi:unnamed protein product [Photorhabdus laumondii subsp. laumondii TTO1]|uniref:Photorhabdus luminescens subsp. laumondii TTO1 complete genome segment 2/17 n=1 Tax=Photorhabdus laumondii subsp. laumondii (strain DSM 15139 / CIP 105565 / TT01) TaxID=243265 RepID=Q7N998_PHOLL|nr:unnamed protein product [Photorhabdus laumondii subsp. laumondii TTO1]
MMSYFCIPNNIPYIAKVTQASEGRTTSSATFTETTP